MQGSTAEGYKHELGQEDGPHDQQEVGILTNAPEDVDMIGAGVEAVKGNGHHKGGKQSRGQVGSIARNSIGPAEPAAHRRAETNSQADAGNVQSTDADLYPHFIADNASRTRNGSILHILLQSRLTTEGDSRQGIHSQVYQEQLDNRHHNFLTHKRTDEAGQHGRYVHGKLED